MTGHRSPPHPPSPPLHPASVPRSCAGARPRAESSLPHAGTTPPHAGTCPARGAASSPCAGACPVCAGTSSPCSGTPPVRAGTSPPCSVTPPVRAGTSPLCSGTCPACPGTSPPCARASSCGGTLRDGPRHRSSRRPQRAFPQLAPVRAGAKPGSSVSYERAMRRTPPIEARPVAQEPAHRRRACATPTGTMAPTKIAKVGGHVHTGTDVSYRCEVVTVGNYSACTPGIGRPATGRGRGLGRTCQVRRITKFTSKESEFVRYRKEPNEKLGTN